MSDTLATLQDHVRTLLGAEFRDRAESAATRAEAAAADVDQVVSDAAGVLAGEIADDVEASKSARAGAEEARDEAVESSRAAVAQVQARPAMWLWDGKATWQAPANAVATDNVLNLSTGELHSVKEVG